jgi:hypothetical protein
MKLNRNAPYFTRCFNEGIVDYHNNKNNRYNADHYWGKAWQEGWDYEDSQEKPYSYLITANLFQVVMDNIVMEQYEKLGIQNRIEHRKHSGKAKA